MRSFLRRAGSLLGATALAAGLAIALPPAAQAADDTEIQILGINDFHGRIAPAYSKYDPIAGLTGLTGMVDHLRAQNPNTVFAAAGDLIGASTFESFIDGDVPTIKGLNAAGLEVSSVGNHEFDQGYADLIDRVVPLADWEYLSANVVPKAGSGLEPLAKSWVKTVDGVEVGFVGAVTEDLDSLVTPAGIAGLDILDIATSVNAEADALKADGADIVVLLVHEGYPQSKCEAVVNSPNNFSVVVNALNANIDAVISGHTHLAYDCAVPVKQWADEGRAVTERPVVSAGQYGGFINQLLFTYDKDAGAVAAIDSNTLALNRQGPNPNNPDETVWLPIYDDPEADAITAAAVANAEVLGAKPLGTIAGAFDRARLADLDDNRGGESTLGNLVAEAQRWAMETDTFGGAEIAFMNPGGLRGDMRGSNESGYPATLTYQQAASVQPFANTLINRQFTGAQIKQVLEEQWQPEGKSRPFLRLGISDGFTYTYDPDAPDGEHILQMRLGGEPIVMDQTYSVTMNSFLSSGGDNFFTLAEGTDEKQAAMSDLEGMVAYMAEFASGGALPVDYSQRSVGVMFPADAPAEYGHGDTVTFQLSSLAMTGESDVTDDEVQVWLGDLLLGTFAVDNTRTDEPYDEAGVASVSVAIPADAAVGEQALQVKGVSTGTQVWVPVTVTMGMAPTGVDVTAPAAMAAVLLLLGSALVYTARRRRVVA